MTSAPKLPATLPAKFKNTDRAWVDEKGLSATPRGLDFLRIGASATLHVRKASYGGDVLALCGVGGYGAQNIVEYLGHPGDGERTWTICAKCRKLYEQPGFVPSD